MNDLKARAVAAYREHEARIQEQEEERAARRREVGVGFLQRLLGEESPVATLKAAGIEWRLRWDYGTPECLQLKGQCPECGKVLWSRGIFGLEELGEQLVEFRPSFGHR